MNGSNGGSWLVNRTWCLRHSLIGFMLLQEYFQDDGTSMMNLVMANRDFETEYRVVAARENCSNMWSTKFSQESKGVASSVTLMRISVLQNVRLSSFADRNGKNVKRITKRSECHLNPSMIQ